MELIKKNIWNMTVCNYLMVNCKWIDEFIQLANKYFNRFHKSTQYSHKIKIYNTYDQFTWLMGKISDFLIPYLFVKNEYVISKSSKECGFILEYHYYDNTDTNKKFMYEVQHLNGHKCCYYWYDLELAELPEALKSIAKQPEE